MVHFFFEEAEFDVTLLTDIPQWLDQVSLLERHSITSINYIFCSDTHLLSINQQYLQHDYLTDVITFDLRDDTRSALLEGDIFISIDRIRENALLHSVSFRRELLRVMIHGFLHLLGYDDRNDELKHQMRRLEDTYLAIPLVSS